MNTIYVASKTTHAPMWRDLRKAGHNIISTWIDEAEPGQTEDMGELWRRIDIEVMNADALLIYRATPDEQLKGAYVELGMAMSNRVPVFAVGFDVGPVPSFIQYPILMNKTPIIVRYPTVSDALAAIPERCAAYASG